MRDDYRMIFDLEGKVLPHMRRLFDAFECDPENVGLFMDYYCSQILRFDTYSTIEAECALNLKSAKLMELRATNIKNAPNGTVCVSASPELANDISRLRRRLKLMDNAPEPDDCFTSNDANFADELYFLTEERLAKELAKPASEQNLARMIVPDDAISD